MAKPTIEQKLEMLYESIGSPKCRHFHHDGGACAKGDRFSYAHHLTYHCDGNICECDLDEDKLKKQDDEERFHARNAS